MNGHTQNGSSSSNIPDFSTNPAQAALFNINAMNPQLNLIQQQQQINSSPNPNLAQQLLQAQNALLSAMPQQSGTAAWTNQTTQQSMFSSLAPAQLAAFALPFISPQLIQEAYALSSPVESSDEPLLVKQLLSYRKRNESYKDALNALHGRNGHTASLWKDYYLDNKDRLDTRISLSLQKEKDGSKTPYVIVNAHNSILEKADRRRSIPSVKKPSPDSFKDESSPRQTATRRSTSKRPAKKTERKATTPIDSHVPTKKVGRNTFNSLTGPSPVYGNGLPQPNADIRPPEPPSRSPTPPTRVEPFSGRGRGNKYTQEDREFFIKFIGWRLKKDPTLNRNDLCQALAEKAPHHTMQSWASHWSNNHDIPDKILAAARGEDFAEDESGSSDEDNIPMKERPLYKEPSTTENSDKSDTDDEGSESEESDDDSDASVQSYSESEMGERGAMYTEADMYICAKYIASTPDWDDLSTRERWDPFATKHDARSAKSWAQYYNLNRNRIMRKARLIRKKRSILSQTARPSKKLPPIPNLKRKLELELDSDDIPSSSPKRQRFDDD